MATEFTNIPPEWNNEGTEPAEDKKLNGFQPKYKLPAAYLNWIVSFPLKCIKELQTFFKSHADNKQNPHEVTAEQVGLGNVDNTADADKVVKGSNWAEMANYPAVHNCSNTDLNTIKKAGIYYGYTGMTNAAFNEIGVLEVVAYSNDWLLQRHTRLTDGKTFVRHFREGTTWSHWEYQYTDRINEAPTIKVDTYTGDGNATKFIDIGFTPTAVIVTDTVARWREESGSTYATYGGMATLSQPLYSSKSNALVVANNGFIVAYDGKTASGSEHGAQTNRANATYMYIAFKI